MITIKFNLLFSFLFCLMIALSMESLLYADRYSLDYKLKYNEALNAYDKNERDEAALICKLLLREYKNAADVYLLLGRIHFEKGFYSIARSYFNKALNYEDNFIIEESKLELYFTMAANYYNLNDESRQIDFLEKIIFMIRYKIAQQKEGLTPEVQRTIKVPFIYKNYLGQAGFALGFVYYNRGDFIKSKDYLQIAVLNGLQIKLSYLMIAHYYAMHTQEQINSDLQVYYQQTQKLRSENREVFFNFYYQNFHKAAITAYERKFFEENRFKAMLLDIEYYKLQLDVEEENKAKPPITTPINRTNQKPHGLTPSLIPLLNTN